MSGQLRVVFVLIVEVVFVPFVLIKLFRIVGFLRPPEGCLQVGALPHAIILVALVDEPLARSQGFVYGFTRSDCEVFPINRHFCQFYLSTVSTAFICQCDTHSCKKRATPRTPSERRAGADRDHSRMDHL